MTANGAVDQGQDVCSLPTVVGSCSGSTLRYTYNRSTGRCEAFYYSECHGNANNFENLEDCQRQCESSYPQGESHDLIMERVFEPSRFLCLHNMLPHLALPSE
ncbi:U-actitoxin-Avd3m [Taenia solium]|eukprot:TsM_001225600 transcript=TsM_001225600 gene=TsM_001225600